MQTQASTPIPAISEPLAPEAGPLAPEAEARLLLQRHGDVIPEDDTPDRVATLTMDLFRRARTDEVFDCLIRLTSAQLSTRVRSRLRYMGAFMDAEEILQDVIINIFRYPDRFDATRAGAFRAWSSTIVDNTIRRHLRKGRVGPDIILRPAEILAQEPDSPHTDPGVQAMHLEAFHQTLDAYRLFLLFYLEAFRQLSERERFVLQMVEVRRMRYAELAVILGIRPEALKMVVFRARRRISERISAMLPGPTLSRPSRGRTSRKPRLALAC